MGCLGRPYPTSRHYTTVTVAQSYPLKDNGIRRVINLMQPDEKDHTGNPFSRYQRTVAQLADQKQVSAENSPVRRRDRGRYRRSRSGWVAEEALVISLYCAIVCQDDFDKAIVLAVNHSGDSDSTGAITGNIQGGVDSIYGCRSVYRFSGYRGVVG